MPAVVVDTTSRSQSIHCNRRGLRATLEQTPQLPSTCSAPGAAAMLRPTRRHAGLRGLLWPGPPRCSRTARRSSGAAPLQTAAAAVAAAPHPHPHLPCLVAPAPAGLSVRHKSATQRARSMGSGSKAPGHHATAYCKQRPTCSVARLGRSELRENSTACHSRSTRFRSEPTSPMTCAASMMFVSLSSVKCRPAPIWTTPLISSLTSLRALEPCRPTRNRAHARSCSTCHMAPCRSAHPTNPQSLGVTGTQGTNHMRSCDRP